MVNHEAMRLLDTDDPIGINAWPLGCYASEAIENEMASFTASERSRTYDERLRLAVRRAINNVSIYADQWEVSVDHLLTALKTRRI